MKKIALLLVTAAMLLGIFSAPAFAAEGAENYPLNSLVIKIEDAVTHSMLPGARFEIYFANEAVSGGYGTLVATVESDGTGVIVLSGIPSGYYIVRQTVPPNNYHLSIKNEQHCYIKPDGTSIEELVFSDYRYGGLVVILTDKDTGIPVSGAVFSVTDVSGAAVGSSADGEYVTGAGGEFYLENLPAGDYKITQLRAAEGYALDGSPNSRTVRLQHTSADQSLYRAAFENSPLGSLIIRLTGSVSKEPLAGAVFSVELSGGADLGEFTTGADGSFRLPRIVRGAYIVTQISAPDGYLMANTPKTQYVDYVHTYAVDFENHKLASLIIVKTDEFSGAPLAGAKFRVTKQSGEFVADVTTGVSGQAIISSLAPGWYALSEIGAPAGYFAGGAAQTAEVKADVPTVVNVTNRAGSNLEILKLDFYTRAPLSGAVFKVERMNGENVGTFTTDSTGKIIAGNLPEGAYIISEVKAPDGYALDSRPQTAVIEGGKLCISEFTNKPLGGLRIVKIDSSTRAAIAGATFSVSKMNGERIGEFTTDGDGAIFLPGLDEGWYTVTETKAAAGYIIDSEPKNVQVKLGESATLTAENAPMAGLVIVKTDAATGEPLAGVVFEITRADGQIVTGSIADGNQPGTEASSPNRAEGISGGYTTDQSGRIQINTLPPGEYRVAERSAPQGYELDPEVRSVTVTPGKLTTLQLTNKQKAGFRLLKIDSVTKRPIYGAEFMVFSADNQIVGRYVTDSEGLIDFSGILTEGRYTIRETRPADGYYADDTPRTVEFRSGRMTEVVWENTPQAGQIQILKLSGDDSELSGLPKGSPLAGAIFEVYQYKSGNLVDRFVSGSDGRAVSKPLPLGRYLVKEVQAPRWYRSSEESLDIEIEFNAQIIKREFLNYAANTGVKIRKTGNYETMPGDVIRYDIKEVANTSSVPLTDFYWRDTLPASAVRVQKIVTGTYNQSLKYKILITTNKGDTRVIADNLSTTQNNVIECRGVALGLASDEYVTSFTLMFGTVKAGFCAVALPEVYVTVNKGLPNGYEFANKADAGGKYAAESEWIIGNAVWVTTVYSPPVRLPRTGY
jgi:uncharacterized surface anchored protein